MSTVAGSRPAASSRRRRSSIASASCSVVSSDAVRAVVATMAGAGNGHQPSPWSATRCRAVPLLPPIQIGGCGWVIGRGWAVMPRAEKCRPSTVTSSPVQMARMTPRRLVDELVALGVVHPERRELALEVPSPDGEREATAREHVERGRRLRDDERVPIGEDHDVRDQAQRVGDRRREAEAHERVEGVVAARLAASDRWAPGGR